MPTEPLSKTGVRILTSLILGVSFVCLALVMLGLWGSDLALAATVINTDITSNTTWTAAGSPYVVQTNTVSIINGAVLTIEPGVTVEFQDAARLQVLDGRLVAVGSAGQPITFTSMSPSPARGIWEGIVFGTDALTSSIEHTLIEYARGAIQISNNGIAPFSIQSNTIRYAGDADGDPTTGGAIVGGPDASLIAYNKIYSSEAGINLTKAGTTSISQNEIYNIDGYCIRLAASLGTNSSNNTVANNVIYGCRNHGIRLAGLSLLSKASGNIVSGNVISNTNSEAIYAVDQIGLSISSNVISQTALTTTIGTPGAGSNLAAVALTRVNDPTIVGNQLLFNGGPGNYQGGLYLSNTTSTLLDIRDNLIRDNRGSGVVYDNVNLATFQDVSGNALCVDGGGYELENRDGNLDARGNWWSTNFPASGSEYTGPVTIAPWITLTATVGAGALPADGVSTTNVVITMNDGGSNTVPAPARTIALSTNAGSISPPVVTLNASGVATATFTAGASPATATITATELCGYAVNAQVALQAGDLSITKTTPQAQVTPGGLVTYTIAYSNAPGAAATNVVVTDTLPANTSYVASAEPGWNLGPTGGSVLTWTRSSLAQGSGGLITMTLRVGSGAACGSAGDVLTNVARIGSATADSNLTNNVVTHTGVAVLCPAGTLAITKTAQVAAVTPGRDLTYTVEYANNSPFTVTNVVISDTLPVSATYVSDDSGFPRTTGSGVISWTVGALGPAQTGAFSLTLHVDPLPVCASFSLTNTAGIRSDFVSAVDSDTSVVNVVCGVDLIVTKNDDIGSGGSDVMPAVPAGGVFTYTISVVNMGTDVAHDVVISETIPVSTSFVGPPGWNLVSGRVYTYYIGTLNPGGGTVVYLQLRADFNLPPITTTVTNEVCVSSTEPEAIPADNCDSVDTDLSGAGTQLTLSKSDGGLLCAIPGQLVEYNIDVANVGGGPVSGLGLTEFLPANTTFQGPANTWTLAGAGTYTRSLGTLNAGQTDTTGFWVQVDPALSPAVTAITNVVTLAPAGLSFSLVTPISHTAADLYIVKNDNIELLNTAAAETIARLERQIGPRPWLDAVKGSGTGAQATSVAPGDIISYTIAYGNAGVVTATNVVVTETLPANTAFVGPLYWTALDSTTFVFTVSTLAPGDGGNLDFRVRVNNPFPAGTAGVTNTVRIGGSVLECATDNNRSVEFTPVEGTGVGSHFVYLPLIVKSGADVPTPTPTPTPTPLPLAYVSDVAVDQESNRVFVASPRHDWVYVIDGATDTISRSVPVGHGPTGLAVLTSTAPNKVFVAHQYGANNWHPGVMAFGVDDAVAHDTFDTGYAGAAPIKITANAFNASRVYVSNYFDKLAVLNGDSGPPEARLGWVVQKGFQGAYGIDVSQTTGRVYLATRDSGELVVFDGAQDRLLAGDYIPTHVKPPQPCSLWSVAVNEATGHVFVPCPQLGRVYVLAESQVSLLAEVGVLEEREGGWALVVAAADAPWIAEIDVPGGVGLGEEGIAVDPTTGLVYITNARNDNLVVLQDGPAPGLYSVAPTAGVGDYPQGVDVNPASRKVYVGNAGDNTVTVLHALTPTTVITTIPLTP